MAFVILTTPELKVTNILFDGTDHKVLKKDRLLTTLVNNEDRIRILDFIQEVKDEDKGSENDFQIDSFTYDLLALKVKEQKLLILAYQKEGDLFELYEELIKGKNRYIEEIRELLKFQFINKGSVDRDDDQLYNQISQINNELMNVQRKLTKTNKELEWQKERYYATLSSIGEGVIALDDEMRVQFINTAAQDLLKMEDDIKGELILEKNIKCINDNDQDRFSWLIKEVRQRKQLIKKEDLLLITNQNQVPIDLTVSPIQTGDKKIIGAVIVLTDITLKKQQEEKLKRLAATDRLTNIMNRRMGLKYLEKQVARVKREDIVLTICFIDINGLKKVNDEYGHNEGDNLIRTAAEILDNNVRSTDAVARIGGDEFLIIFTGCNLKKAKEIWNRVESKVKKWNNSTDKPYKISLSYGFAQKERDDNLTVDQLIEKADKRMYEKKNKYYEEKRS